MTTPEPKADPYQQMAEEARKIINAAKTPADRQLRKRAMFHVLYGGSVSLARQQTGPSNKS